ncbi:sodium-independent sulfate anion transporter-like isoform X2 [Daktulosphaira vitifoliae]|uniref:sodium-independent sulfate anion transporter-like isoform X2 n=1 Tax=Daktulosphaira vitifoliae TaxID=58002 RepID=UPI0021AAD3CC|nr:sodium-independent sulfate anion transporter-like isoform X2 [Daktulosphaira vitifoliae]
MTITKDDIDSQQRKRSSIDMKSNLQSEYTIGSNDFILVDEVDERIKTNVKEKLQLISPCIISSSKTVFTYKNITKRLPILQWLPKYSAEDALGDLLAGITVGLTVIPQSMAYSSLAGLPPEFGLYGSFVGCLMYVFLGTCKDVPMGPTAIVSLMTYNTLHGLGPIYGTLLCFLSGVIQLLMGIVGLGFLIDFISGPVSSGFTSAVAILIIASQIKDLIGVKGGGSTLVDMVISMSKDIENYSLGDTMIGVTCIIIILLLRGLALFRIGSENVKEQTPLQKMLNRSMWLIGTFRNSIVVIVCSYISYLYIHNLGHDVESQLLPSVPFKVIGKIPSGMPSIDFPQFSIQNGATTIGFFEMVSKMGSGVIVLPLIALLENISVCKTFANGKTIDATQELVAIGLCNIGNSFVHGLPGSGSFSRSAVNNASGVRTPMGSLYTGVLVIVALMFFTPYFYYIPKSVLAAIIIAAVVFMVEVRVVRPIYRSKKSDLIPGLATFFACLVLPLEIGVLIGIGLNLVSILYHAARPKILIEVHKVIEILTKDFSKRGQQLFFYNLKPSVVAVFEGVQPKDFITYYQRHELDFLLKKRTNTSSPSEVFPV